SPANLELRERAVGVAPFAFEVVDAGAAGAAAGPGDEGFELVGGAFGDQLDLLVDAVAHPAGDAEAAGLDARRPAEADALHHARHDAMHAFHRRPRGPR